MLSFFVLTAAKIERKLIEQTFQAIHPAFESIDRAISV